jgi:hypothetical protein
MLVAPLGLGVACLNHRVPFQCSANPHRRPDPTAVQASRDAQATPVNAAFPPDFGGDGSIDQRLPFQPSISCRPAIDGAGGRLPKVPTAKQPVADQHATLEKLPWPGVGWINQRFSIPSPDEPSVGCATVRQIFDRVTRRRDPISGSRSTCARCGI